MGDLLEGSTQSEFSQTNVIFFFIWFSAVMQMSHTWSLTELSFVTRGEIPGQLIPICLKEVVP